ncbi:hypothetical protein EDEG_00236 [Edhazardia aedis USNM 41457]|uniref:Uncharacterized protein n=1 Tax=Edhazardia aedis (strain USNM 41457) TaxID=1003232 RepID=J9D640_EDHAE|nr:hypothetical protein EDEG_00236 [Edhazardia aedis USNM 41457]|eukprot:EJW03256.1 hypothetical protein EDEG_00236 [Edhazardia aedis USNM 41457]
MKIFYKDMLLFLVFRKILGYTFDLSILYEKQVASTVGETYRLYLQQHIKEINRIIENHTTHKLKLELTNVLAFNQYNILKEYESFSRYAGSNQIQPRIDSLNELNKNFILAVSTGQDEDLAVEMQKLNPCGVMYLVNLDSKNNYDIDLLSILHKTLLDTLAGLLGVNVPNLLDKNNYESAKKFSEDLKAINIDTKFGQCVKETTKESDSYDSDYDIDISKTNKLVANISEFLTSVKKVKGEKSKKNKQISQSESNPQKNNDAPANKKPKKSDSDGDTNQSDDNIEILRNPEKKQKSEKNQKNKKVSNIESDELSDSDNKENQTKSPKINVEKGLVKSAKTNLNNPNDINKISTQNNKITTYDTNQESQSAVLKAILDELKGLNRGFSELKSNRSMQFSKKIVSNNFESNRPKSFSKVRHFEDLRTEDVINIPTGLHKGNELVPFDFNGSKTQITDLKLSSSGKDT